MVACLYAHAGNVASAEGKSCENPRIFGAVGQWGQNCGKNVGNFASEKGKSYKTRIPGAMGPKLWKNVGNVASEEGNPVKNARVLEEGKSCEKPKSFGAHYRILFGRSTRKHIAFGTTHEITCLNSGEFICRRQKITLQIFSQTKIYPVQNWSVKKPIGAFLQTTAPVLDKIYGLMDGWFLSSIGLGSGTVIGGREFLSAPSLDKIISLIFIFRNRISNM